MCINYFYKKSQGQKRKNANEPELRKTCAILSIPRYNIQANNNQNKNFGELIMSGMNIGIDSSTNYDTRIQEINVPPHLRRRVSLGIPYVDDVLGGGMVPSQIGLFTGSPGAGKTTQFLQIASASQGSDTEVLYNSREESVYQVKMTAERLGLENNFTIGDNELVDESSLDCNQYKKWSKYWDSKGENPQSIIEHAKHIINNRPGCDLIMLIDSLQTLNDGKYGPGEINGPSAVRSLLQLARFAKTGHKGTFPIIMIIGHVTKDGKLAGKNTIPHAVDVHMHLQSVKDKKSDFFGNTMLGVKKNRFGCNGKTIMVEMRNNGLHKTGEFDGTLDEV
jgi:DNA repair protein RadA/Sms